jgi:hypothetical protein
MAVIPGMTTSGVAGHHGKAELLFFEFFSPMVSRSNTIAIVSEVGSFI